MTKESGNLTNILLESGTNEVEIIEFSIGKQTYGINVAKVREIIQMPDTIIDVPKAHPMLKGMVQVRERIVPIIDLVSYLNIEESKGAEQSHIIICEFNTIDVGFSVNSVSRIHRLSWQQITPPSDVVASNQSVVVAMAKLPDVTILLLDFEKITTEISPESGIQDVQHTNFVASDVPFDRSEKTIFVADDSAFIRQLITGYLKEAKYKYVEFINGQHAWDMLKKIAQSPSFSKIEDHCNLLITDIEMPQMDGLHLIRNIKESNVWNNLPCIVFSSLVSKELAIKCKSVGASAEISKPQIDQVVMLADKYVL